MTTPEPSEPSAVPPSPAPLRDAVDRLLGPWADVVSWSIHLVGERFRPIARVHPESVEWSPSGADWAVPAMRRALEDVHRQRWTTADLSALDGATQVVGRMTVYSFPVSGRGLPFGVCNVVVAIEPSPSQVVGLVDAVAAFGVELETHRDGLSDD